MAKIKLTLVKAPTFKATVQIPVPGQKQSSEAEFTFKYRTRDEFKAWYEGLEGRQDADVDILMECISGWDLAEPFDREHVEQMVQFYPGASRAISDKYVAEQLGVPRLGN